MKPIAYGVRDQPSTAPSSPNTALFFVGVLSGLITQQRGGLFVLRLSLSHRGEDSSVVAPSETQPEGSNMLLRLA